jgi:hypothetical protein
MKLIVANALPGTGRAVRTMIASALTLASMTFGVVASAQAVAPTALTATAVMTGRLFADSSEKPVADAEVSLPGLELKTRTNAEGRFVLRGLPVGTHRLEVRRVGFEPYLTTMTLLQAKDFEIDISLQKAGNILATFVVAGSAEEGRLKTFNDNRRFGFGTFVTREKLAKYADLPLATALVGKAPMLIGSTPPRLGGSGMRVATSNRNRHCLLQVVVNDMTVYSGYEGERPFDLASIQTQDVLAVEHYTNAQAPQRYRITSGGAMGAACGTLVLWTR